MTVTHLMMCDGESLQNQYCGINIVTFQARHDCIFMILLKIQKCFYLFTIIVAICNHGIFILKYRIKKKICVSFLYIKYVYHQYICIVTLKCASNVS